LVALAVGVRVERRNMADGWLLKGIEDLVNKVKLLESEKREAVARIQVLDRENCELAALIAQASAMLVEALKEGTTADLS
jgi:hypothetical protein